MQRILVKVILIGQFYHDAQVHHGYAVANVAHHAQVVGDEQVGQAEAILQFLQQIDHLGLPKARVLVWVDNPAALYSMQIQGSGMIKVTDGTEMRVGYAGNNGQAFVAIGKIMIEFD